MFGTPFGLGYPTCVSLVVKKEATWHDGAFIAWWFWSPVLGSTWEARAQFSIYSSHRSYELRSLEGTRGFGSGRLLGGYRLRLTASYLDRAQGTSSLASHE